MTSFVDVLMVVTIMATVAAILVPAIGVAYLGATGKISIIQTLEHLVMPSTWGIAALLAATSLGVGWSICKMITKLGLRLATRAIVGLLFAVGGLGISIYQTYKLVTGELPPRDKERYVAIMVATIILCAVFGSIIKNLPPMPDQPITVARWGEVGLKEGSWVMVGKPGFWNYLLSFKWQPGFGNRFAPYTDVQEYVLPPGGSVKWPSGWGIDGWWKGLFGQRIYVPPPPPP